MLFISTTCFDFDFFADNTVLLDYGISNIELSGGGLFYKYTYIKDVLDNFLKNDAAALRIHNYFPLPEKSFIMNFASGDTVQIEKSFDLLEQAVNLCSEYDVPYYSFHPGYLAQIGNANKKGHFDFQNSSFIDYPTALNNFLLNFSRIKALADKFNIKLAIENLFPRFGKIDSLNNTFNEFNEILLQLPKDTGILLDLGHLNVAASALGFDRQDYIDKMITKYGNRIFEVHISGNDGTDDQHLTVTDDDWQLDALKKLKHLPGLAGQGVSFTLEARQLDLSVLKNNIDIINNIIK